MPTYEYECGGCGHRFERFEPITADTVRPCPECGAEAVRLIGAGAGLIFKEGGSRTSGQRRLNSPDCDRQSPCCGRDSFCGKPPCDS